MPKAVEDKLKREASRKGLTGKRKAAYVYGTMNKRGLLKNSKGKPKDDGPVHSAPMHRMSPGKMSDAQFEKWSQRIMNKRGS